MTTGGLLSFPRTGCARLREDILARRQVDPVSRRSGLQAVRIAISSAKSLNYCTSSGVCMLPNFAFKSSRTSSFIW